MFSVDRKEGKSAGGDGAAWLAIAVEIGGQGFKTQVLQGGVDVFAGRFTEAIELVGPVFTGAGNVGACDFDLIGWLVGLAAGDGVDGAEIAVMLGDDLERTGRALAAGYELSFIAALRDEGGALALYPDPHDVEELTDLDGASGDRQKAAGSGGGIEERVCCLHNLGRVIV